MLLIAFIRIDTLKQVFARIRQARPTRLYLAADGPRRGRADDQAKTEAVRRFLTGAVDWDCELRTLFRDENVGFRPAIQDAITWLFENEEMGIILEDDTLPDPSFFPYAEEMLLRYRDDPRVMQVSGNCYLKVTGLAESYFFSKYPHTWGWASWRDSWAEYSLDLSDSEVVLEQMDDLFWTGEEKKFWQRLFGTGLTGKLDSWDYFWILSIWRKRGLSAFPTANLVKNIGFDSDAVNTNPWKDYKGLRHAPLESIGEIHHPEFVGVVPEFERRFFEEFYRKPALPIRALKVLREIGRTSASRMSRGPSRS